MNEEELLKKIKDSAEDIQVPDSLKPETVAKRLEQERKNRENAKTEDRRTIAKDNKIHRFPVKKIGAWAAAAMVFLTVMAAAWPAISDSLKKNQETGTETGSPLETDGIPHLESYEQLYALVRESWINRTEMTALEYSGTTDDSETGLAAMVVPESAVEETTMAAGAEIAYVQQTSDTGSDFSSTNTQEENIDEGEIVKTDGTYIYAMDREGTIRIVEADSLELISEEALPDLPDRELKEMYVDGDRLQVIWQQLEYTTFTRITPMPLEDQDEEIQDTAEVTYRSYSIPVYKTGAVTYDISDRRNPKKIGSYSQDGRYLTSRRYEGTLYLFTGKELGAGSGEEDHSAYIPETHSMLIPCEKIYLPYKNTEGEIAEIYDSVQCLIAASVQDTAPSKETDSMAAIFEGDTFYISEENIYVASPEDLTEDNTCIMKFSYKDGMFAPQVTKKIPGSLNDNFSMDEYQGMLRVVTNSWEEQTVKQTTTYEDGYMTDALIPSLVRTSGLYVLDENLEIIGSLTGLAPDEEVKSVRFLEETAYFVTYEQVDPLFSVDLSDPEEPELLGKLKVTGFSEYLHPYGEEALLGIGWETDPDTGETIGLKCSMFDISNPSQVKEKGRLVMEDVQICTGLDNYKAILAEPEKNIFGFVIGRDNGEVPFGAGYAGVYEEGSFYYAVLSYEENKGFQSLAYLPLETENLASEDIRQVRGMYIQDTFYMISAEGIVSYDMQADFLEKDTLVW